MLNHYEQAIEQIRKANNILITFPVSKNGEATASALALNSALSKLDKNVEVLADLEKQDPYVQKPSRIFSFLPGYEKIKTSTDSLRKFIIALDLSNTKVKQIKYKMENDTLKFLITPQKGNFTPTEVSSGPTEMEFDLVMTLNAPDMESLGEIYEENTELFYNTPVINIDNDSGNEEFCEINLVELTTTSTAEIIFNLLKEGFQENIDEDTATCLLSAIIYKTKSFKTLNITPNALSTTSELISLGGRREEIMNKLYRSKDVNVLKLWGRVLARLSGTEDNKLIWSGVLAEDFKKTQANKADLTDIIDELVSNIPQAEIAVIFYESTEEEYTEEETSSSTRALIYSSKNIDLIKTMEEYAPRGNKKMVEIKLDTPLQETKKEITEHLQNKMKELGI